MVTGLPTDDVDDAGRSPDLARAAARPAGGAGRGRRRHRSRTPSAAAAARGRRHRPRSVRAAAGRGRDRPDDAGARAAHRRAHRGRPGRRGAQHAARATSRPSLGARHAASSRSASSSPTPPTSCARRWPRSRATPSCARAVPTTRGAADTALAKVEAEAGRMSALVEDLLLLARLDSGRPLAREPVDLTRLLVEAVADARVLGPDHQWRLDAARGAGRGASATSSGCTRSSPTCSANARRHTPPAPPSPSRAPAPAASPVHDDGPGFPGDWSTARVRAVHPRRQRPHPRRPAAAGLGLVAGRGDRHRPRRHRRPVAAAPGRPASPSPCRPARPHSGLTVRPHGTPSRAHEGCGHGPLDHSGLAVPRFPDRGAKRQGLPAAATLRPPEPRDHPQAVGRSGSGAVANVRA